jgi:hypothetical protein
MLGMGGEVTIVNLSTCPTPLCSFSCYLALVIIIIVFFLSIAFLGDWLSQVLSGDQSVSLFMLPVMWTIARPPKTASQWMALNPNGFKSHFNILET